MRRSTPLLAVPLLAATACFSDAPAPLGPAAPTTAAVEAAATANTFTPNVVQIARGGTVTWTFGTRPHNVTFIIPDGAPANVPTTTNNQVSRTFSTVGTFAYNCTLHAGMTGRVVVKDR